MINQFQMMAKFPALSFEFLSYPMPFQDLVKLKIFPFSILRNSLARNCQNLGIFLSERGLNNGYIFERSKG